MLISSIGYDTLASSTKMPHVQRAKRFKRVADLNKVRFARRRLMTILAVRVAKKESVLTIGTSESPLTCVPTRKSMTCSRGKPTPTCSSTWRDEASPAMSEQSMTKSQKWSRSSICVSETSTPATVCRTRRRSVATKHVVRL